QPVLTYTPAGHPAEEPAEAVRPTPAPVPANVTPETAPAPARGGNGFAADAPRALPPAAPSVRHLARKLGIDPARLRGSRRPAPPEAPPPAAPPPAGGPPARPPAPRAATRPRRRRHSPAAGRPAQAHRRPPGRSQEDHPPL